MFKENDKLIKSWKRKEGRKEKKGRKGALWKFQFLAMC